MNRTLNVGVIGLGIGVRHLQEYQKCPDVKIVALCDRDKDWLDHVGSKWNISSLYTDYRELLANPQIDAVSLCLPTGLHAEIANVALQKDKHVLCEKPMALNSQEAQGMADSAKRCKKVLMISQNQRFAPQAQFLHECAVQKRFGDIYLVRAGWLRPMGLLPSPVAQRETGLINRNWFNEKKNGGGVLRDLGSHLIDLSMWLLGFPAIDKVLAANFSLFTPQFAAQKGAIADAEDTAIGMIQFANGSVLQLDVNFGSYVEADTQYLEIRGTKGGAMLRNDSLKLFGSEYGCNTVIAPQFDKTAPLSPQLEFTYAIREKKEPLVTSEQAVSVIKILDALYESGICSSFSA